MTVKELIELLQSHEPDKQVWYFAEGGEDIVSKIEVYESDPGKIYLA
jgi:hypothetical protein